MVTPAVKQTWTVMGVLLNMMGQGMVLSFPSILLPSLFAPDSKIPANIHVASWVASCIGIAGIPGFMTSSFLMDMYGRRLAHAVVVVPGIVGWLLIYFATNISVLIIGRSLCGLAAGATVSLGAVVIGEYTSPSNRGMFLNLKTTAVCVGNMIVHLLGNFYAWKTVALIGLIPHILSLIIIATWPESPAWLASRKRFDESEKSFYWLRGKTAESRKELGEMLRAQKERIEYPSSKSFSKICLEFFKKFTKRDFIKPVIIIFFGGLLLETCGRHIFPAYALQIIEEVTGNKSQSFYYTLGIDLIISASALFSSVLVKIMKRRTLLFGSGFAALLVLMCVCLYLYLSAHGLISKDKSWIAVTLFALYFILSNLGCTPIPLALLGEVFPLAHRGAGSSVAGFILSIFVMAGMQVTPYLLVSVKVYGTFAVFGTAMGLALVVLYFILPETKDKTLQQIEDYFNFGRFKDEDVENDDEVKMKMIPN
ncbi:facilitated trehalose transporter Tret1-2 homolog [Nymphalis io]|uniref:facilitated trehalose transporter Tret1-2 homolog n=1 Tax=Inachis io TaxID=171585 RepID=UPI002167D6AE|nr:facilitated trehalose transporter Tret1-2 homolog [Nymphalis io]